MEDCERKYKEAFNMAVLEHKSDNEAVRESIERIFPQLKESKGEKIRKALINFYDGWGEKTWDSGIKYSEVVAWLEKQKTSEESLQYVRENHSPSEMSDFQAAMNIAVAKAYDKGYNDGLEKHGEQKPAWSEEDKGVLLESISVLQCSSHWVLADKLKSLKDRVGCEVNCTTTKEWSANDEKMLNSFLHKLEVCDLLSNKEVIWIKNKLKSIKERCTWKPSDAQMASITCAVRKMKASACYDSELVSLYQDLKKLKG